MKRNTIILLIIFVIATMLSCNHEDMAKVTIYTGLQQARISFIDKVIALISMSSPVKALPAPTDVTSMTVTVTAPDMLPITMPIPLATGSLTFEVPAGNARTFTVVAYITAGAGAKRQYGGITVANLSPGENKDLLIEMGELFTSPPNYNPSYYYGQITLFANKDYHPLAFNIYQYVDNQWIFYTRLDLFTMIFDTYTGYFQITITIDTLSPGTYGIAGVNKYGEGEMYTFEVPY